MRWLVSFIWLLGIAGLTAPEAATAMPTIEAAASAVAKTDLLTPAAAKSGKAQKQKVPVWAKKRGPGGLDKWKSKCSAGKRSARNNPANASQHPPPCTRT